MVLAHGCRLWLSGLAPFCRGVLIRDSPSPRGRVPRPLNPSWSSANILAGQGWGSTAMPCFAGIILRQTIYILSRPDSFRRSGVGNWTQAIATWAASTAAILDLIRRHG